MSPKNERIFSGEYSKKMWKDINTAKTKKQLRWALYHICCKMQELERSVYESNRKV